MYMCMPWLRSNHALWHETFTRVLNLRGLPVGSSRLNCKKSLVGLFCVLLWKDTCRTLVCEYIYIYTYTYTYMYICTCTCIIYMEIHLYLYTNIYDKRTLVCSSWRTGIFCVTFDHCIYCVKHDSFCKRSVLCIQKNHIVYNTKALYNMK